MKLIFVLTVSLLSSAFGACQWVLTDADLGSSSNTRLVSYFDIEENGEYEWEESVLNWFWVTGTPPPLDPNPTWSNYFANLAENEWEFDSAWEMELEDGDRVSHFEDYTIRWGHEVFSRSSGSPTTASRFLRYYGAFQHDTTNNPGMHTTESMWIVVTPMGSGGSGGGN